MPQGSLQQAQGKSNVKLTVLTILAIHVVVLGGLLMQGCSKDDTTKPIASLTPTNDLSLPPLETNVPPAFTNASLPVVTPPVNPIETATLTPSIETAAPAATKEYAVIKGDMLAKIAKANGVTVNALIKANPGIDPNKLRIGQKLQIPAPAVAAAATTTHEAAVPAATADGAETYVVQAGDSLTKIAKIKGVSIKSIQTANNLKTTQIKVGQKLKLPVKAPGQTAEATGETKLASTNPANTAAAPATAKQ